ncbi:hypothetical protein [Synechococcus sp. BA-132 BA5]|uniref:hypothetical protein n=1 Tax=Synechococcus sp. BA-132 BA5 TaxID=3110252 RepID=UPI002B2042AF|nr:hypothetical protein [Synechococcus sp. BA-132 BA5]
MALLAYFLVDLAFQAWPVALLKPLWLDQMGGFLMSRSTTPLLGVLFVAAASELDPSSTSLAKRAALLRRLATWVAIGYLLFIPVQIYAGVKLLNAQQQEAAQLLAQANRAMKAIETSNTEDDLRRAYEQIPGAKPPLPEQLPKPLSTLKGRLVEAMDARSKKAQYDFDQRLSTLWQRSLELLFGNILRMLIFFVGFAALGRPSPSQPTLLTRLLNRNFKSTGRSGRHSQKGLGLIVPDEWLEDDKETTR